MERKERGEGTAAACFPLAATLVISCVYFHWQKRILTPTDPHRFKLAGAELGRPPGGLYRANIFNGKSVVGTRQNEDFPFLVVDLQLNYRIIVRTYLRDVFPLASFMYRQIQWLFIRAPRLFSSQIQRF